MGRRVCSGGGQSSLGYLFGGGEASNNSPAAQNQRSPTNGETPQKTPSVSLPIDRQMPAGIQSSPTNNYFRAEGQNCGNFITDRPSTKVHAAPGGRSSLGYLFGGEGN